jgi:hypothetical protein
VKKIDPQASSLAQSDRIQAIHHLFDSDERLFYFLFHHKKTELRRAPDELLHEARGFSHGEYILIQAAIDMWCDQGGTKLSDLLSVLDNDNFFRLMCAMARHRGLIGIEEALKCCDW